MSNNTQTLLSIYEGLLGMYGRQQWWPADSPFEVMLGAILTQNTQWSNVEKALVLLRQQVNLEPEVLLRLSSADLESCLKPSGYFRIKTQRLQNYCHWYLAQGGFEGLDQLTTSELRERLLKVKGIGPETADDILLYAFYRPVFVIDAKPVWFYGNVVWQGSILPTLWIKAYLRIRSHLLAEIALQKIRTYILNVPFKTGP